MRETCVATSIPGADKRALRRAASQVIPVTLFGVAASVAIFAAMQRSEYLRAEANFLQMAEQRVGALRTNVDGALDATALMASHFAAAGSGGTSRRAFSTLVGPALASHGYLQAVEWIPKVRQGERAGLERLARADGVTGFGFRERRSDGALVEEAPREEYFPVFYVEPVNGNERALGYDLGSNPVRLEAMMRARDTGLLASTAPVKLVQEKADQWGTLIFAPVYSQPRLASVEERRKALEGFGLSVVRVGDLVAAANYGRRPGVSPLVDLHLFDLAEAGSGARQLYPTSPITTPAQLLCGLNTQESFQVGGRAWLLVATPGRGFNTRPLSAGSILVLVFGLSLTGLHLRYLKAKVLQAAKNDAAAHEIEMAQAELKQTNGTLEAVIQSAPLAVVTMDLEGRVTMWNPAAERIHGWSKEDVLGRRLPVVLLKQPPDEVARVHKRILTEGGVTGLEYVCLTKAGEPITVSLAAAPLYSAAGEQNGAVYLVTDVTERKLLECQLAQAQKLESIGQLAAGIAHEINTPIQFIGDNLRFIREGFESWNRLFALYRRLEGVVRTGEPATGLAAECEAFAAETDSEYVREEIPRAIGQSLEGIDHVARIVRAMKDFSHFGEIGKTGVNINHVIESTLVVSRNEWKYVADVQTAFDAALPQVPCVPGELNQVILNLIINSAHAIADAVSGRPGAKGVITVSTRRDGDWAEIRVADTGVGIPAPARPHIFNPFFTTKPLGKGTGQGLAIAHTVVVQRHGGTIAFETEVGTGTTFTVRLPLEGASEPHPTGGVGI